MDQHLDKHWPGGGGGKIKVAIRLITPKGKVGGGEGNGKTQGGPCLGGFKIKMTLESAEPKGKGYMVIGRKMVKPRLGLAGGVLFKANCQGVPINPTV